MTPKPYIFQPLPNLSDLIFYHSLPSTFSVLKTPGLLSDAQICQACAISFLSVWDTHTQIRYRLTFEAQLKCPLLKRGFI